MASLSDRLDTLPEKVRETRRFPLGRYRGLAFGIVLYPGDAADIYLEGAANRHGQLSRDHRGPRAVLNALDRLSSSYEGQCDSTRSELAIAQGQLRDHEARIGRAFAHDDYLRELTDLRDRLKMGLSQTTPEPGTETVAELAERIRSLKAAHTIDATPTRTATRRIAAEVPVTARILRRAEAEPAMPPQDIPPVEAAAPALPAVPPSEPEAPRQPAYRQKVSNGRRNDGRQLSFF